MILNAILNICIYFEKEEIVKEQEEILGRYGISLALMIVMVSLVYIYPPNSLVCVYWVYIALKKEREREKDKQEEKQRGKKKTLNEIKEYVSSWLPNK